MLADSRLYPQLAAMADILTSSPPISPESHNASPKSQAAARSASMPPRRRVRATASPSPVLPPRASTPSSARGSANGRAVPDRGGSVRTPVPAKYSTSYGSPMTQLPDRSAVGGGGNVTKAAAEIFTKVQRDNQAAAVRRQIKDQARQARASGSRAATASPPPPPPPEPVRPSVEVQVESEESGPEEQSGGESSEEGSEYEDEQPQAKRPASTRALQRAVKKRARDDDEAEANADKERRERNARLRRERSAEAQRRRKEKAAEAEAAARAEAAAKEDAERERREQQAREEAARAAMPPPPHPPPPPSITMTPATASTATDASIQRPPSARSFIEERNLFLDAEVHTPKPLPRNVRQPAPPPEPEPSQPTRTESAQEQPPSFAAAVRRSPRRPNGTGPAARLELTPTPERPEPELDDKESSFSPDEDESRHDEPDAGFTTSYSMQPQQAYRRLRPLPSQITIYEEDGEQSPALSADGSSWRGIKNLLSPRYILTTVACAMVMLHLARFAHSIARPDLFENPLATFRWYGWRDWTNNVGQFLSTPLLHPHGVLTDDQYDDLKDYLQRRTTTTEAAVENLQSILPRVVSVRKDKNGKITISDDFWNALQDRIKHDENILTLDGKAISEKHWTAIRERLQGAGLLGKPLSTDDVERIVEQSAPASWEKWLQKNQRKVADILGQPQGTGQPTDEAVVTRDEFIRELADHLAKSKTQIDSEMESLRKDLYGLVQEVRAVAASSSSSSGGMTQAEVAALIRQAVSKEIGDRQLRAATKAGGSAADAALRRRLNHFSPGNGAMVDLSLTSPTWKLPRAPLGSKEWLKSMRRRPQFLPEPIHALTAWSEPGHCWCAARGADGSYPAGVAVRLASPVIPQHVVLEHVDPAATTDPLAMPRDVEVWAVFEDPARRERVRDWMAAAFPGDYDDDDGHGHGHDGDGEAKARNRRLLNQGLVKIGAFTYEHRAADDGVVVHRLSDELERLRAATDLVLVRALNNYGAVDHTCFYRIRLYGDVVDLEADL